MPEGGGSNEEGGVREGKRKSGKRGKTAFLWETV
jgi:hypothetical protein